MATDSMLNKMRVSFAGVEEEVQDDQYNVKGRIPAQKTVSFKGERKRPGRRFLRQFSRQTSDTFHDSDDDIETAIAAAAYAITFMEEGSPNQKKPTHILGRTETKNKSKREDNMNKPTDNSNITKTGDTGSLTEPTGTSKISRWLSGKETKDSGKSPGNRSMRKSATFDQKKLEDTIDNAKMQLPRKTSEDNNLRKSKSFDQMMPEDTIAEGKMPEKAIGVTPTVKKILTFSDEHLNEAGSQKSKSRQDLKDKEPEIAWYPRPMESKKEETKADVWEKEQMAKLKKWDEKMNTRILEWENDKKARVKKRLERKERDLEEKRARYLQEYRNEMVQIDKMAGGARAAAEERRKKKEVKTKEKAKRIRSTGKLPRTCFCF